MNYRLRVEISLLLKDLDIPSLQHLAGKFNVSRRRESIEPSNAADKANVPEHAPGS